MRGLGVCFAVRTGLEPATPCVTGMYSNQLNYRTNIFLNVAPLIFFKSVCKDNTDILFTKRFRAF